MARPCSCRPLTIFHSPHSVSTATREDCHSRQGQRHSGQFVRPQVEGSEQHKAQRLNGQQHCQANQTGKCSDKIHQHRSQMASATGGGTKMRNGALAPSGSCTHASEAAPGRIRTLTPKRMLCIDVRRPRQRHPVPAPSRTHTAQHPRQYLVAPAPLQNAFCTAMAPMPPKRRCVKTAGCGSI